MDFAGGYGLLVRMMRDRGYNFYWYDKYAKDIFNPDFIDISLINSHYDAITAFEVFEHLENPLEDLKIICDNTETLIFSTDIIPDNVNKITDWSYFSMETGQHITFYTYKSLAILGNTFGMNYAGLGNLHIYTRKNIDWNIFVDTLQNSTETSERTSLLHYDHSMVLKRLHNL